MDEVSSGRCMDEVSSGRCMDEVSSGVAWMKSYQE